MFDEITLANPVVRVLASAALMPDLRSILLIDATYEQVMRVAQVLEQLLTSVSRERLQVSKLSTTETDDVLWGMPFLPGMEARAGTLWKGRINGGREDGGPQLIVIPNLAQVSLAAERGFVMAAGADVVHLERHGQHEHWQPRICWLAACAEQDIGKVSTHLLDRFAIRIHAGAPEDVAEDERVQKLLATMGADPADQDIDVRIPEDLLKQLSLASKGKPLFTTEAAEQVFTFLPPSSHHTARRDLALGRLAIAQAMLTGDDKVQAKYVDIAAANIGLSAQTQPEMKEETPEVGDDAMDEVPDIPLLGQSPLMEESSPQSTPVYEPDTKASLPEKSTRIDRKPPYIEDDVPPEREAASLRLPFGQGGKGRGARGQAVGVEKARDLHDLALAATVFEATKYWVLRRTTLNEGKRWLQIRHSDLRQHRRLPVPETLLVLVIDYTSLRKCAWEDALLPYLEWAYTSRASVALIRVGAMDAEHELRAERIMGRSLLAPQIGIMLEAKPGRATPLAHGLDLALQTLHHAMQHGRSAVSRARLVVISDGRGNVPLNASQSGEITLPVRREGIDDALRMAEAFNGLSQIEIVFLDPKPSQLSELPEALAATMGVASIPIPRRSLSGEAPSLAGEERG